MLKGFAKSLLQEHPQYYLKIVEVRTIILMILPIKLKQNYNHEFY